MKKITRYLSIFGIISLIVIYSISTVLVDSPTEEITDFSEFTILYDTTLVTTTNYDTHLTFVHNDESSGTTWEGYLYNFSTLGNYSDFYANATVEYEYTGSMLMESAMELGTSFYNNGTYGGPKIVNRLFGAGIWDAWAGSGGKYYVRAFPDNVLDQYESGSGTLASSGTVVFHCNRTSDVVEVKITKQGTTQLAHTWSTDVSRPINYMYFFMGIDPTYCTYSMVNFTSIYVSLGQSTFPPPTTPPTTPPGTSPPPISTPPTSTPPTSTPPTSTPPSITSIFGPTAFVVGLFVIVNLTVIYIYRRRRN